VKKNLKMLTRRYLNNHAADASASRCVASRLTILIK